MINRIGAARSARMGPNDRSRNRRPRPLRVGFAALTHEVFSTSPKRIKIPNACIGVGVKSINPYEMLRSERAQFVLGPAS